MNEIVKYHNDLNDVNFNDFNKVELDLFFSICNKLKEKKIEEITLTFRELQHLSNYKSDKRNRFIKDIENVYTKLINLNFRIETDSKIIRFVLFRKYEIDKELNTIQIVTSEEFKYILNQLTSNFTRFELEEFKELNSKYTKNLYRLLKQYRKTGYLKISLENFRKKLDIPDSYRMTDINRSVLNVVEKEFKKIYNPFLIKKIKKGRNIAYLEFFFNKENLKETSPPVHEVLKFSELSENEEKSIVTEEEFNFLFEAEKIKNKDSFKNLTEKEIENVKKIARLGYKII